MVCYHPLQVSFSIRKDGKKDLSFISRSTYDAGRLFSKGLNCASSNITGIPCGKCMGCRLESSRQWAVRCMHEASLYEDNCFITLTYHPDNLPKDGSLVKQEIPLFMKRLRQAIIPKELKRRGMTELRKQWVAKHPIRYFACGEYGEDFSRPHYHVCLFNYDFADKKYYKTVNGYKLFTSKMLEDVWGLGFCPIGSLTFDSAAYVARYCTKKINGIEADKHYQGRQPEFGLQSNKPGIGYGWYQKWKKDCFPSDYLIVNKVRCKPPRYYDKKLEQEDSSLFERIKQSRLEFAKDNKDNTYRRLMDRELCQQARFRKLIRTIENKEFEYVDEDLLCV